MLLIDEADVFLESRRDMDIYRNSLVAVFLRALERHSGVLCVRTPMWPGLIALSILTTNRIKSFDEAFLSRISYGTRSRVSMSLIRAALRYPELERSSRKAIWIKVRSAKPDRPCSLWVSSTSCGQCLVRAHASQFLTMANTSIGPKPLTNGATTAVGDASPPAAKPASIVTEKELEKLSEPILNGRVIKQLIRAGAAIAIAAHEPLGFKHLKLVLAHQQQFQEDWTTPDTVRPRRAEAVLTAHRTACTRPRARAGRRGPARSSVDPARLDTRSRYPRLFRHHVVSCQ